MDPASLRHFCDTSDAFAALFSALQNYIVPFLRRKMVSSGGDETFNAINIASHSRGRIDANQENAGSTQKEFDHRTTYPNAIRCITRF